MPNLRDQTMRPSWENKILCFEVCDVRSSAELGPIAVSRNAVLSIVRTPISKFTNMLIVLEC